MTTPTTDEAAFADLGLGEVADDPNNVPDGTYKAVVSDAKIFIHGQRKEGENRFVIISYKIIDPDAPAVKDNVIDEWKSANKGDEAKKKSFLKARFLSLGVSKEDVDAGRINLRQLVGIPVIIKVKNNNGFTNVNNVTVADDSGWGAPTASQIAADSSTPAASQGPVPDLDF